VALTRTERIEAGRPRALVISALGVTQILAWGSSYYLPTVLAKPIAETTGWSYAWVIGGFSLGLLVAGLAAIRIGRAIDHYGGRPVLAASAVLLAAGLAMLAAASTLPIYLTAWLVLGFAMGAGLYDAAFSTLGRLYGRGARSAITNLTLWGGFASTVCWPLSAYLVENIGWRGACLVYAALHLTVALPLHLYVIPREARKGPKLEPLVEASSLAPSAPLVHRGFVFGLLATILTTGGTISAMWSVHLISILQANGIAFAAAVGLGTLIGPAQVGARVVERLAGNRHHPIWTLIAAIILITAGLALLWSGISAPAVALLSYGAGNGIWSIARGTLPLALFGASGYAVLMGRLATPSLIAQALAPSIGAVLIEHLGATTTLGVLTMLGLSNVVGVALLWLVSRRPAVVSPVSG
jgi:MFS family permease